MQRRDFIKTTAIGTGALLLPSYLISKNNEIPSYLKGYEKFYEKNPRRAAKKWFKDAKFGLFVHYALASLLPRGKEGLRKMIPDKHVMKKMETNPERLKGDPDYDKIMKIKNDLKNKFTAEKFDADKIADLAVKAEMKYVNFTTKHLGGLYMYKTSVSNFTSLDAPAKRDLVGELAEACKKKNLGLFLYVPPETAKSTPFDKEHNFTVLKELCTQYGPIAGIWFDGIGQYYGHEEDYPLIDETYGLVRKLQPHALISFKEGATGKEDFISPEHFLCAFPEKWKDPKRQEMFDIRVERYNRKGQIKRWNKFGKDLLREVNTVMQLCGNRDGKGVAPRGGWINDEEVRHLTADEVWMFLTYARKYNSNLLMNIGLRGDGSIHPDDEKTLTEVGERIRKEGFPKA